jgi:hypothetical protein
MKRSKYLHHRTSSTNSQAGFSLFEYIIALIIVGVGLVCWLNLCVTGVKNGSFVRKLDDIKWNSSAKGVELLRQADQLADQIPVGQQSIGSIAPDAPISPDYSDILNENGWLITYDQNRQPVLIDPLGNKITNAPAASMVGKFLRQWKVVKDLPGKGEITIYVSIVYIDTNQIMRVGKFVKTDGIESKSSPTP